MSPNGHHQHHHHHPAERALRPGIYAPIPTFFHPGTEDLDLDTFAAHVVRIARAGVGIVVAGSMGEAHHLSSAERLALIGAARHALDAAGLTHEPIIAGTGLAGTRLTIELTREAARAGADVAIVISAGYFVGALGKDAQRQLFTDVADASPIPVMIYNYPGATGGLDIESDVIEGLAAHPNIAGVKLTCGNVGKLTRVAGTVTAPGFARAPGAFLVLGGFADFLVPSLAARAHGAITGLGNLAPHAIARCFDLASRALETGDAGALGEAQRLQSIIAQADRTIALAGIAGTKALLARAHGYGGVPRRPLLPMPTPAIDALWAHPDTRAVLALEAELAGGAASMPAKALPEKALVNGAPETLANGDASETLANGVASEKLANGVAPALANGVHVQ